MVRRRDGELQQTMLYGHDNIETDTTRRHVANS